MNQESLPPNAGATPAGAAGPSAGQLLRSAREARQISLEELVAETRINRATLEALEADRDPPQNAAVFVRGYFKRCAKVLGLDEVTLIRAYEARAGGMPAPQPVTIQWNNPEYTARRPVAPAWLWPVLAGGAVFGVVLWAVAVLKDDEPAAERSRTEAAAASSSPRVVQLTPQTLPGGEDTAAPTEAPATTTALPEVPLVLQPTPESAGDEATAAAPDETAGDAAMAGQEPSSVPATPRALFLEFTSPCWTAVVDDDNERLLYGMFKAGDRKEVIGEPPYRVSVGFAPGVKLYYEGQPVDFSSRVNPGDTTARFSVPFR